MRKIGETPLRTLLLLTCGSASALLVAQAPRTIARRAPAPLMRVMPDMPTALVAEAAALQDALPPSVQTFLSENKFLIGILTAIATRLVINEIRARIEKPVIDEAGRRVSASLTPDTEAVSTGAWAKLAACVALDAAGDASELLPVLGEFTDVGFAPLEAGLLKLLFQSDLIAGFGFVEEILPFTDVIPTFTLAWCLQTLWPTTPLARRLLPESDQEKKAGEP